MRPRSGRQSAKRLVRSIEAGNTFVAPAYAVSHPVVSERRRPGASGVKGSLRMDESKEYGLKA